jgi:hypothetical protein
MSKSNQKILDIINVHYKSKLPIILNLSKYFYDTGVLWLLEAWQLVHLMHTVDASYTENEEIIEILNGKKCEISRSRPRFIIDKYPYPYRLDCVEVAHERFARWLDSVRLSGHYHNVSPNNIYS